MTQKMIAIACQGGGSHTAFTAGVLRTLLRKLDPQRDAIVGLSGTSGGAMCALLAWYGLLLRDPAKGAELLDAFWRDMTATSPWEMAENDWLVWFDRMHNSMALPELSPYELPAQGQEKLAGILEKLVPFADLERLIGPSSPALLVGAVNAAQWQVVWRRKSKFLSGLR